MKKSLIAVSILLLAAPVSAQRVTSPYRFLEHTQFGGVYAGYLMTAEDVLGAGPQSAPGLGVNWGIAVSGPVKLTVELGYTPTTRTVRDTVFEAADSTFRALGDANVRLLGLLGNVRLDLTGQRTWHAVQPFLFTGAGVVIDLAGDSELEAEQAANARFNFGTSFAGQFGAGIEWYPGSRLSLRADGRGMLWKLSVPEAFQLTTDGRTLAASEWAMNIFVGVGLSFHF